MKKITRIILLLCCSAGMYAETVFTFSSAADMSQTKDGISLVIAKGSGQSAPKATTDYETSQFEMRLYVGNTITVSGDELNDIQLVCAKSSATNKQYTGLSANTGSLVSGGDATDKNDWKVDHWTGNAQTVVFSLTETGQRRIQKVVVNGVEVVIDPVETVLPTEADLETEYAYTEPTVVNVPDTQFFKNEYAFISNNILVYCGQGSIIKATDTTAAYFNCNANYSLTFTATAPIKGIEIDGFVRKAFDASCDHGEIEYLTDADFDMEGSPALVIRNIDATSVTLSCPKQLRCYGVRVYFQNNPDPLFPTEGIEDLQPSAASCQKILRGGQVYIIRNERTYTPSGAEVK